MKGFGASKSRVSLHCKYGVPWSKNYELFIILHFVVVVVGWVTSTGLHGRLKSYNIGLFTDCFIHYLPYIFTSISPMLVTILMIGLNPMLDVVA